MGNLTLNMELHVCPLHPPGVFGVNPVGVAIDFFVSMHYLLNQLMDFDQTCIYTLLGEGKS